jgi:hypothetical protein
VLHVYPHIIFLAQIVRHVQKVAYLALMKIIALLAALAMLWIINSVNHVQQILEIIVLDAIKVDKIRLALYVTLDFIWFQLNAKHVILDAVLAQELVAVCPALQDMI